MIKTCLSSILFLLAASTALFSGCAATTPNTSSGPVLVSPSPGSLTSIMPPPKRELIAIAGFENKSSFSADKLWDTCSQLLATSLVQSGYFRTVEWERMKRLFDWDMLASQSIMKNPETRGKAQKILLCEYFITGAVTSFDIKQSSKISALYKQKTIDTSVRVDLLLQNAKTGEYLSAATGEAVERQIFQGGLSGRGQTGTWISKAADLALDYAIKDGLYKLIRHYDQLQH